jgi:protein-disulfide isomerase
VKKLKLLLPLITGALFFISAGFADPNTAAATKTSFSPTQVQDIQTIVHNYLVTNPTVLVEASKALQAQQMAQMQKAAMGAIEKNKAELFNDPETPIAGNTKNPTVYLVEFFDYQCGHCRQMADVVDKVLKANPNVKLIFKDWPIFGGTSKDAAKASIAAYQQDPTKFYDFHNALYAANPPLDHDNIMGIAKKAGLDTDKLASDMKSKAIETQLRANFLLSQELRLQGTPAFVLSNKDQTEFKFIPGATSQDSLQNNIDALKQPK